MLRAVRTIALAALASLAFCASAHESTDNRATLVLREPTHLVVTLYVGYCELLHRTLAPQQPVVDFLAAHASMPAEEFARMVVAAQARWQSSIALRSAQDKPLGDAVWAWPKPADVQQLLRMRLMQSLADPSRAAHEEPTEVRAELRSSKAMAALKVVFPPEFQKVIVVSYRPSQVTLEPGKPAALVQF
jgi:hypothetical protein